MPYFSVVDTENSSLLDINMWLSLCLGEMAYPFEHLSALSPGEIEALQCMYLWLQSAMVAYNGADFKLNLPLCRDPSYHEVWWIIQTFKQYSSLASNVGQHFLGAHLHRYRQLCPCGVDPEMSFNMFVSWNMSQDEAQSDGFAQLFQAVLGKIQDNVEKVSSESRTPYPFEKLPIFFKDILHHEDDHPRALSPGEIEALQHMYLWLQSAMVAYNEAEFLPLVKEPSYHEVWWILRTFRLYSSLAASVPQYFREDHLQRYSQLCPLGEDQAMSFRIFVSWNTIEGGSQSHVFAQNFKTALGQIQHNVNLELDLDFLAQEHGPKVALQQQEPGTHPRQAAAWRP